MSRSFCWPLLVLLGSCTASGGAGVAESGLLRVDLDLVSAQAATERLLSVPTRIDAIRISGSSEEIDEILACDPNAVEPRRSKRFAGLWGAMDSLDCDRGWFLNSCSPVSMRGSAKGRERCLVLLRDGRCFARCDSDVPESALARVVEALATRGLACDVIGRQGYWLFYCSRRQRELARALVAERVAILEWSEA